jgi:hypothetical protein
MKLAPKPKKLIPGPNSKNFSKALEKPKVVKPSAPEKKVSRPGSNDKQMIKQGGAAAEKQMIKQGGKVTITGSATGSKSLTAAQVAKMNKMTSKYKMGNR